VSIALDAHDTKLAVRRELTKGNLFSSLYFRRKKSADYVASTATGKE
jgi:hypothetical protein